MNRLLAVARHEYLRFARRRSFQLGLLAPPLLLLLLVGVGELSRSFREEPRLGYVDLAGILEREALSLPEVELEPDRLLAFPDAATGRAAMEEGLIDNLFVLPPDYLQERSVQAYSRNAEVGAEAERILGRFIRASLAHGADPDVRTRLLGGETTTVRDLTGERETGAQGVVSFLLPLGVAFLLLMAGMTSAGYLLQTVTDEKENRTMEILATSVSARQLILGKATGLIGIAGTQLAVWIAGLVAALLVAVRLFEPLADTTVPWGQLGLVAAFFIPAFLLLAAIMMAVGSAFPEFRQSQQLVALVNTVFLIPLFVVTFLWQDPNGLAAVLLTLFPPTALVTVPMRTAAANVPAWQLVTSWVLLVSTTAATLWAAPRLFRAGMLRYGQRLDLRATWEALRTGGR